MVLPRPGGRPVFVDPHGHRVRRLRHAARIMALGAAGYLALLALGLAGPATPPFSLFPRSQAGESGKVDVQSGTGAASARHAPDATTPAGLRSGLPTVTNPDAPSGAAPAPSANAAPQTAPPAVPPASNANPTSPAPSGRSAAPAGAGAAPKSSPPMQAQGPPARQEPPGQANKSDGSPGNGNAGGNGPPANHGQQMAAQHSRSPNH
jgi:hypothetical protein